MSSNCSAIARIRAVLRREPPDRWVYAPNYWQWFTHHTHHGLLPAELRGCESQLDLLRHLGVDVFSRNVYCDPTRHWFGGLSEAVYDGEASRLCRERGAAFMIHACGNQKALLPLIGSLGVDGLEGVAYPPLGDVELDEALRLSGDRMFMTGGISAFETERFTSYDDVRRDA